VDTFPAPATEEVSRNHEMYRLAAGTAAASQGGSLWQLSQTSAKHQKARGVSHSRGWVDVSTLRTGCLLHSLRTSAGAREEG
jgi:hypothetical protein